MNPIHALPPYSDGTKKNSLKWEWGRSKFTGKLEIKTVQQSKGSVALYGTESTFFQPRDVSNKTSQKWRTFRKNLPSFFKTKDSALKMDVTYYSEMLLNLGQIERRQIPEVQYRYWFKPEHRLFKTSGFVSLRTSAELCATSFRRSRIYSLPISNYPDRKTYQNLRKRAEFRSHSPCCSRDIVAAIDGLCALHLLDAPQDDRQVSPSANDVE